MTRPLPDNLPRLDLIATRPADQEDVMFFDIARSYAERYSMDPDTQTGAVIRGKPGYIIAEGTNRLPHGARVGLQASFTERPQKYMALMHAERDAIMMALRNQEELAGATMFLPWFPCHECAQEIIASGLAQLVCTPPDYESERAGADWRDSWRMAEALFAITDHLTVDFVVEMPTV